MKLSEQGFDFEIFYSKEKGHFIEVPDEVVSTESVPDAGSCMGYGMPGTRVYMKSGRVFGWEGSDVMDPNWQDPTTGTTTWI